MLFLLTTIIHIIIIVLMYDIFLFHKLQFNDPSATVLLSRKYYYYKNICRKFSVKYLIENTVV